MGKEKQGAPPEMKAPDKVSFDYIKSNFHRVICATGAHGGPSPSGELINMSLFNERHPIPQRETFELNPDGRIGDRTERMQRDALVREVEVTIVLEVKAARALSEWLAKTADAVEALQKNVKPAS